MSKIIFILMANISYSGYFVLGMSSYGIIFEILLFIVTCLTWNKNKAKISKSITITLYCSIISRFIYYISCIFRSNIIESIPCEYTYFTSMILYLIAKIFCYLLYCLRYIILCYNILYYFVLYFVINIEYIR